MQAAKDTFLKTLAIRLAAVNPSRTVAFDGNSRPAVVAGENETAMAPATVLEAFWLSWLDSGPAIPGTGLMFSDCRITYGSKGGDSMLGTDRGRTINAMGQELLQMSEPRWALKFDYTQNPPAALTSNIFWTRPVLAAKSDENGVRSQSATVRVFFFPEVN